MLMLCPEVSTNVFPAFGELYSTKYVTDESGYEFKEQLFCTENGRPAHCNDVGASASEQICSCRRSCEKARSCCINHKHVTKNINFTSIDTYLSDMFISSDN